MATRCFRTEHKPGGIIEKWYSDERGHITRTLHQNCDGIIKAIQEASLHPGKNMRLTASVPTVLALQWAKMIGHSINSPEWLEYAIRMTQSSEFRSLSTGVKI